MARQHYIIIILGVLGMALLSFLMKHFLQVRTEQTSPLAAELHSTYAAQFEREPEYELTGRREGAQGIARVKVYPRLGVAQDRLAKQVGQFVWRRLGGRADAVHVVCVNWSNGGERLFDVDRPYQSVAPPRASVAQPKQAPKPRTGARSARDRRAPRAGDATPARPAAPSGK